MSSTYSIPCCVAAPVETALWTFAPCLHAAPARIVPMRRAWPPNAGDIFVILDMVMVNYGD